MQLELTLRWDSANCLFIHPGRDGDRGGRRQTSGGAPGTSWDVRRRIVEHLSSLGRYTPPSPIRFAWRPQAQLCHHPPPPSPSPSVLPAQQREQMQPRAARPCVPQAEDGSPAHATATARWVSSAGGVSKAIISGKSSPLFDLFLARSGWLARSLARSPLPLPCSCGTKDTGVRPRSTALEGRLDSCLGRGEKTE